MLKKIIIGFVVLIAIFVIVGMCVNPVSNAPAARKTPEEQKQLAKDEADQDRAVVGAMSLRAAMRNPESFKLASAFVTKGGAACYKYRGQNGFGGMNIEYAVLAPGASGLSQNASTWNSQCAGKGSLDETYAVNARMGGQ